MNLLNYKVLPELLKLKKDQKEKEEKSVKNYLFSSLEITGLPNDLKDLVVQYLKKEYPDYKKKRTIKFEEFCKNENEEYRFLNFDNENNLVLYSQNSNQIKVINFHHQDLYIKNTEKKVNQKFNYDPNTCTFDNQNFLRIEMNNNNARIKLTKNNAQDEILLDNAKGILCTTIDSVCYLKEDLIACFVKNIDEYSQAYYYVYLIDLNKKSIINKILILQPLIDIALIDCHPSRRYAIAVSKNNKYLAILGRQFITIFENEEFDIHN